MVKRIIGAIIGMVFGFVIFKIANSVYTTYTNDKASIITISLLLGGLLVAFISDGFKPKTQEK